MSNLTRFRALGIKEKALIAVALLLDGHDASTYLSSDKERSTALVRAAEDLAMIQPDLRMSLIGTYLRSIIEDSELK